MARSCGTTTMFARWLILTLVAVLTSAFSPVSPRPPRSVVSRRFDSCTSLSATSSSSRRDVLVGGFMAAVAAGWGNPRIVAAVDDLTMPTEEDQRKIDEVCLSSLGSISSCCCLWTVYAGRPSVSPAPPYFDSFAVALQFASIYRPSCHCIFPP